MNRYNHGNPCNLFQEDVLHGRAALLARRAAGGYAFSAKSATKGRARTTACHVLRGHAVLSARKSARGVAALHVWHGGTALTAFAVLLALTAL
ncbi:hypothetical protein TIFTF001_047998 [Ficus carica]|uniref:Uncharacterized protein n=1 Tax=Ficus carica TaxID=3494 RepID=A0AA87ZP66_FICCA|nr:hypothetical protein TIFTF001_047998 [Ficus carica]